MASPFLALAVTVLVGTLLFALLGKDPVQGLRVFSGSPFARLCLVRTQREGHAVGVDSAGAGCVLSRQPLEYRGRGAIHHGAIFAGWGCHEGHARVWGDLAGGVLAAGALGGAVGRGGGLVAAIVQHQ